MVRPLVIGHNAAWTSGKNTRVLPLVGVFYDRRFDPVEQIDFMDVSLAAI